MSRSFAVVVMGLLLAALAAAPAGASRPATRAEAAAVRHAALDTLHGGGWRVSHVRVSTARTVHRYASAAVEHRVTGAGGSMLLARVRGHWQRRFLGTDGFCAARAPYVVLVDLFGCPSVRLSPSRVIPGGQLVVTGAGWPPSSAVVLLIGPPQSEATRVATARTGARGTFQHLLPIDVRTTPGRYVLLACRRSCRDKAAAPFRVVAP